MISQILGKAVEECGKAIDSVGKGLSQLTQELQILYSDKRSNSLVGPETEVERDFSKFSDRFDGNDENLYIFDDSCFDFEDWSGNEFLKDIIDREVEMHVFFSDN
jgi:hypothetical protein